MDHALISWLTIVATSGLAAGINAVAGGGTFLTFPALTGLGGLSEKVANMTSTVGLWPGAAASVAAARTDIRRLPRSVLIGYSIISVIGGALGSLLLIYTTDHSFRLVIPWLLAFATLIFAFSAPIARWAGRQHGHRTAGWTALVGLLQFAIALYGGYFGAGIGVLMIAGLAFSGLESIHQMNALKVALATIINAVACVIFISVSILHPGAIDWRYGPAMAVASIIGGFTGMHIARRIPQKTLHAVILTIAILLTAVYFKKAYG
jgi:hypothetical protein